MIDSNKISAPEVLLLRGAKILLILIRAILSGSATKKLRLCLSVWLSCFYSANCTALRKYNGF